MSLIEDKQVVQALSSRVKVVVLVVDRVCLRKARRGKGEHDDGHCHGENL